MSNVLFVLLDGMEDDPHPALGGRKPYEVARMPFIRSKAPYLNYTTGRGYTQMFLNEFWTGHPPDVARAAIEAYGLEMDMTHGRTAFRLSPAFIDGKTVKWAYNVDDRAEDLEECVTENMYLLQDRNPQIKFFIHGRSVITMEYPYDIPETPQAPVDGPYVPIPGELGELIVQVAGEMDGLTVYPWGIGKVGQRFPPHDCVKHMTAISDSPTALGIASIIGHKIHMVPDLDDRFPVAREALKRGHVFLHMDEVDEYSHQKDPHKKIAVLEHIDSLMEEYFSDVENIVFFVDHGTSCVTGTHILTEVPFRTTFKAFDEGERVELASLVPKLMENVK